MKEEKNHVGRPTNEEVKLRKQEKMKKIFIPIVVIFVIAFGIYTVISNKTNSYNLKGETSNKFIVAKTTTAKNKFIKAKTTTAKNKFIKAKTTTAKNKLGISEDTNTSVKNRRIRSSATDFKMEERIIKSIDFTDAGIEVNGNFKLDNGYSFEFADIWFSGNGSNNYYVRALKTNLSGENDVSKLMINVNENTKYTILKENANSFGVSTLSIRFYFSKNKNKYYTDYARYNLSSQERNEIDNLVIKDSDVREKAKNNEVKIDNMKVSSIKVKDSKITVTTDIKLNDKNQKFMFADVWFTGINNKVYRILGTKENIRNNNEINKIIFNLSSKTYRIANKNNNYSIAIRFYYRDDNNNYYTYYLRKKISKSQAILIDQYTKR